VRFTIYLNEQEAEAIRAAADAEKRDVRDQVVWLALKALREKQAEEGRDESTAARA
jgi:hypothetical protein